MSAWTSTPAHTSTHFLTFPHTQNKKKKQPYNLKKEKSIWINLEVQAVEKWTKKLTGGRLGENPRTNSTGALPVDFHVSREGGTNTDIIKVQTAGKALTVPPPSHLLQGPLLTQPGTRGRVQMVTLGHRTWWRSVRSGSEAVNGDNTEKERGKRKADFIQGGFIGTIAARDLMRCLWFLFPF